MDVVVAEPVLAPFDVEKDLRVTSRYVDTEGRFHVVGEATNHVQQSLTLRLQAICMRTRPGTVWWTPPIWTHPAHRPCGDPPV